MAAAIAQEAGQAANNPELVDEGQHEKAGGKVQKKAGLVKKTVFGK